MYRQCNWEGFDMQLRQGSAVSSMYLFQTSVVKVTAGTVPLFNSRHCNIS